MNAGAEKLVESLLYEGYALYPYTPGATKNATPTPFGIVYAPADAVGNPNAFDHLQVECVALAPPDARLEVAVLFLEAAGERHQGVARRVGPATATLAELAAGGTESEFAFENVTGRVRLDVSDSMRITVRVDNTTPADGAGVFDRAVALRRALLSTHVLLGISEGRFASPLEREGEVGEAVSACENVNTWPVLASPSDDAMLAASILLPDHPQIAPESRGNLFDNTEIEEALLLHVHALSDTEREEIASQDPAVKRMIERAAATTPEDIVNLHGTMRPSNEIRGETEVLVDGKRFRRGGKVVLRLGRGGDPYDTMLDGRIATVERIYIDYDGRPHMGVSVDDDPMRDVLAESGRFLYFFSDELEVSR